MKHVVPVALIVVSSSVLAGEAIPNILEPYTSICEEQHITRAYFNEGRWTSEKLPAGGRLQVVKLEYPSSGKESMQAAGTARNACANRQVTQLSPHIHLVQHCYSIKEYEAQGAISERSEMCSEYYNEGEIVSVECSSLTFHPDGTFQRRQWLAETGQGGRDAVLQISGICRLKTP